MHPTNNTKVYSIVHMMVKGLFLPSTVASHFVHHIYYDGTGSVNSF